MTCDGGALILLFGQSRFSGFKVIVEPITIS
jgi:hypothetical protein